MRQGRLKAPPGHLVAYYHCLSRIVNRDFLLGDVEKTCFVKLMRRYELFCGLQLLTYCVLSNHFHLLLLVPARPKELPSDEELARRVEEGKGKAEADFLRQSLKRFRAEGNSHEVNRVRERYFALMWDVSIYMKLLKQSFTQWYNRRHERKGTLWEERFKSVLVEGAGHALSNMAAYIDLNVVRAGIMPDPASYRWCGYGEAMGGSIKAQEGIRVVVAARQGVDKQELQNMQDYMASYRVAMACVGCEEGVGDDGHPLRAGFSRETVAKIIASKGQLGLGVYLRCRVRYFTDGLVMGSREFVNEIFKANRHRFGPKRKDGARRMRGVEGLELYTMRDLKLKTITISSPPP